MQQTISGCISFYLNNGYILTPLSGKIPIAKRWQNTQYDDFFSTDGNYGVVLQDDDLVIDIDPRNKGLIPLWLANVNTLTIQTGGGGWHYYFKKPKEFPIVGLLKEYPGVEFKTKGQQVVGAGSKTEKEYIILNDTKVIECPLEILHLIERKQERLVQKTDKKIEFTDDKQTQDRYIHYLNNCQVAIQGQNGDMSTFQVACMGRDLGLDEMTTLKLMLTYYNHRCVPAWPNEEITVKVNNAYKYAQNDAGTLNPKADFSMLPKEDGVGGWEYSNNKLKASFRNALNTLLLPNTEVAGLFRFNEFSEEIEFTRQSPWHKSDKDSKTWTDADAVLLREWISVNKGISPATTEIHEAVLAIAKRNNYHPIKEYLRTLKWDGKARVKTWLIDYLGVEDNAYTRAVSELVLTAMILRIHKPGIKFDYMMVLEGVQGQGKSRVCKTLGGQYHIEARLDPHNKDLIDYIRSKWVIEMPEMDTANRSETNAIKAFLSRDTDRCRLSYARTTKDFQRQCIFIGTYNPTDGECAYLKDPTGNRRFWPIKLPDQQIDIKRLEADRDQLLAEAQIIARTYDKDRLNWLGNAEADRICKIEHKSRMEHDPWHDYIAAWLDGNIRDRSRVTSLYVWGQAIGGSTEKFSKSDSMRISKIFRDMGWEKVRIWNDIKGYSENGWQKPIIKKIEDNKKELDIF